MSLCYTHKGTVFIIAEWYTFQQESGTLFNQYIHRALYAFGVRPQDVKFIASSATIGKDDEAKVRLATYLSDIAGINIDQIEVIDGERAVPQLPPITNVCSKTVDELTGEEQIADIINQPQARQIRELIAGGPKTLKELIARLYKTDTFTREHVHTILSWLDLLSSPGVQYAGTHFLPLRGHLFHRVLHGLWACCDPLCSEKRGTPLDAGDWNFGMVYMQQRTVCKCGSPVYELAFCNECNTEHLLVNRRPNDDRLFQGTDDVANEFELDSAPEDDDEDDTAVNHIMLEYTLGPKAAGMRTMTAHIDTTGVIEGGNGRNIAIHLARQASCCTHCGFEGRGRVEPFRHAYLGAPFFSSNIVPTLLEYLPDGKTEPLSKPYRGRSLITFTDSRQGTARIAVKLQQDAERIRLRGLIVNLINESKSSSEIASLDIEINELQSMEGKSTGMRQLLGRLILQRDALLNFTVSWDDLVSKLKQVPDISQHMLAYYKRLSPEIFESPRGLEKLVRCLLIANFSTRPKRANTTETLGLVQVYYEGLDKFSLCPHIWSSKGLGIKEWKDFLKICLDFYVRAGIFLNIEPDLLNWLGTRFRPKLLLPPDAPSHAETKYKKWPLFNSQRRMHQHRLVRLLARVLRFDNASISHEQIDIINDLMMQAWRDLTQGTEILTPQDNGYQLTYEKFLFRRPVETWFCPVSLKVVDTTLRGITPYLRVDGEAVNDVCEQLTFPPLPIFAQQNGAEKLLAIRQWLQSDEMVAALRKKGVWTEQSDRIVEGGVFFRVAEHSAQQPAERLQEYESQFKKGDINVLSCSTTMEMGVDIGGLTIVSNHNVPPHPSNYLQRAGRAGRRKESRALSITLCKNNPLDLQVFNNPKWPYVTPMKQPHVTLNSEKIVQRHINAFLFGAFMKQELGAYEPKANCEWFFKAIAGSNRSICDIMLNWLKAQELTGITAHITEGINIIKAKSILLGRQSRDLVRNAFDKLELIFTKWDEEYTSLNAELTSVCAGENDFFSRKVKWELERHCREYLITELVRGGFLPGYGFPTDITTFNPYSIEDFKRRKKKEEGRDEQIMVYKGTPSRDLAMGLAEYAPGSQVVLDGRVYTSDGIVLNWHKPIVSGDTESQEFLLAWRCRKCGNMGVISEVVFKGNCSNPACNHAIEAQDKRKFIVPNGFSVGFYTQPNNDVSQQTYIPVPDPWIFAKDDLKQFPNESLGYYRAGDNGLIFHHSEGENGNGYALCLKCGHAASMSNTSAVPDGFSEHKSLRGVSGKNGGPLCNPTPSQIKRDMCLGYNDTTDVFELYLKDSSGHFMAINPFNQSLCWTLGVALRYGLTSSLGVNADEVGVIVKQSRIHLSAEPVYAICLYDKNGGGAGFCSNAPQFLWEMFEKARGFLDCAADCDAACEHCLLQFDTRNMFKYLDRKLGLSFLSEQLMQKIALPESDKLLGAGSVYCNYSLYREMLFAATDYNGSVDVYVYGPADEWNISTSAIRQFIPGLKIETTRVFISETDFEALATDQRLDLLLLSSEKVKICLTRNMPELQKGRLLGVMKDGRGSLAFAATAAAAGLFDENWGNTSENLLVKCKDYDAGTTFMEPDRSSLLPASFKGDVLIDITNELDGILDNFGDKFWSLVLKQVSVSSGDAAKPRIKSIFYRDRYIANPSSVMILYSIVKAIPFESSTDTEFVLDTLAVEEPRSFHASRNVYKNWYPTEEHEKKQLMEELLGSQGKFNTVNINFFGDRRSISHSRSLAIEFDNGQELVLRLDQGMGYWGFDKASITYPFELPVHKQVSWIEDRAMKMNIRSGQNFPTHLFIKQR